MASASCHFLPTLVPLPHLTNPDRPFAPPPAPLPPPCRPWQYEALLYGGRIPPTNPDIKFDSVAPPATFISEQFAHLFFKTRE